MTVSFYLFLKKPEDRYTFFSFWEYFSILVFSVMLLKLLNSYSVIEVAYFVDLFAILILIASFFFGSKRDKSSRKKLRHHLSKLKNYNQKELEKFIINLLQKYQFNSIHKFDVKDANDTINDTYLVAQRDGLFYEIRTIANGKELNERTINEVSNKFRDSTTQIENRILFSNSESKKSTENLIVSYGIKFNLIDSNKINQLVYAIEPANNIPSSFITQFLIKIIDSIQNLLILIKSKLIPNIKYQKENSIGNVITTAFLPTTNTDNNAISTVNDQKDSTLTNETDDHLNCPITPTHTDVNESSIIEEIETKVNTNTATTAADQKDSTLSDETDDHLNCPITPTHTDVNESSIIEEIETNVNNSTTTAVDQNDSTPADKADDHLNSSFTPTNADIEESPVIEDIESTVIEIEEPVTFDFSSTVSDAGSDNSVFSDFIEGEFGTTDTADDELLFGSPSPVTNAIIDEEIGTNIVETDTTQDDELLLNSAIPSSDGLHHEEPNNTNAEFVQDNELLLSMSVSSADIDNIEAVETNEYDQLVENQSNDVEAIDSEEMLKILLAEQSQLNELNGENKKKSRNKFK
ncbi:hypothetical protein [Acinetobacter sp. TGL-Y2]|uniref:hypothetical protein n=1 Tax=Acinetobacter sp. TGL-Y2 TaxID=1407071 RepID=UPI00123711FB|nr:hypothetical protein [Acinetobacter sp. TGL-Y2]